MTPAPFRASLVQPDGRVQCGRREHAQRSALLSSVGSMPLGTTMASSMPSTSPVVRSILRSEFARFRSCWRSFKLPNPRAKAFKPQSPRNIWMPSCLGNNKGRSPRHQFPAQRRSPLAHRKPRAFQNFVEMPRMQSVRWTNRTHILSRKQFTFFISSTTNSDRRNLRLLASCEPTKTAPSPKPFGCAHRLYHRLEFRGFERECAIRSAIRAAQAKVFFQ